METREVIVSSSTQHPNSAWVKGQTEAFIEQTINRTETPAIVMHDRDTKFTKEFVVVLKAKGIRTNALPVASPNLNGRVERFIQSIKRECLGKFLLFGRRHLPKAVLVNDRFHVIKLYNEMLTELRRELHREAATVQAKAVLKGTRWLLLKRADGLDPQRGEPDRLREALKLNQSLAVAYYLKDDLNRFWKQPNKAIAAQWLKDWLHDAETSGIRLVQKFAKTLASRRQSLLAWYDYPISTAPLEAVNNKIRLLHRQAYGYRNPDFFQLKLYALHRSRYALVG